MTDKIIDPKDVKLLRISGRMVAGADGMPQASADLRPYFCSCPVFDDAGQLIGSVSLWVSYDDVATEVRFSGFIDYNTPVGFDLDAELHHYYLVPRDQPRGAFSLTRTTGLQAFGAIEQVVRDES